MNKYSLPYWKGRKQNKSKNETESTQNGIRVKTCLLRRKEVITSIFER